jgi:class 3 adenylate cyclase/peptidoglycan hydrolase-like protein with peptidoglycan-binding domain
MAEDDLPSPRSAGTAVAPHRRRLSAILHADLTGFVRLMEGAEDRTVDRLKSVRAEVWQAAVEGAGGRIVNVVADSVLAEFGSAVAAVTAAIDIQDRMALFNDALDERQRLMFRIGLHLGEVIVDETETIFGDAVNVAARIQLMAEPGGIAVSSAVRDATHSQIDRVFVDGGKHHAKNVSRSLRIYHVCTRASAPSPLAGMVRRLHGVGVATGKPLLWGTIATTLTLLVGGYLASAVAPMTSVSIAANNLSAVQLEQALAERRRADALAAEKSRLQEEARQRAETAAEARRQASIELENARQARQDAERELARLKADIEARRKAEETGASPSDQATMATLRAAEEAAQRKAETEAATLRKAEEEAAKRVAIAQPPVAGRHNQLEADAAVATLKAATGSPRANEDAETAERQLRLEPADRQRLQIALTSLGFDTRGDDGMFGQRTREMITAWQKARNQPPTGFVTRAQQRALLKEAARVAPRDDEQENAAVYAPPPTASMQDSADGLWRGTYECGRNGNFKPFTLKPEVHLKARAGTWYGVSPSQTNDQTISIGVSIDGTSVRVTRQSIPSLASASTVILSGVLDGNTIRASNDICTVVLTRASSPNRTTAASQDLAPPLPRSTPPIVARPAAAPGDGTPPSSPDGMWRGTYECGRSGNFKPFVLKPVMQLRGGAGTWYAASPSPTNDNTIGIDVSIKGTLVRATRQSINSWSYTNESTAPLLGELEGNTLQASNSVCTMVLTRDPSPVHAALDSR